MFDEKTLIKRSLDGDEESFKRLIDIYKNYVFAIILNFTKDYGEVENLAQEVFLQIYLSLPTYGDDNFKAWVGKIASNKSIDHLRRKKSSFREETLEASEQIMDEAQLFKEDGPEDSLIEKESREILLSHLNSLPHIYKLTIEKFYFQEMSYEEIAQEEGLSKKTIESRLYRGRNMLKEKWRKR